MQNNTFQKATRLLCSPVSLGAMLLLLLNDHVFRVYAPSWWTGKLGDFAWLFFFPFALAAILALLIPSRVPHQEKIVKWLVFGLTGGIFALAKTSPFFHALTVYLAETILGFPVGWVRDPSDLIALISLVAGWWFWERRTITASSRPLAGWAALSFAALLTIANAPALHYGINALCVQGQDIIAGEVMPGYYRPEYLAGPGRTSFYSNDGGLSWVARPGVDNGTCERPGHTENTGNTQSSPSGIASTFYDPTNKDIQYRFTGNVSIERSDNGGKTWQTDFTLPQNEAVRSYQDRFSDRDLIHVPIPVDAQVDPITHNAIFAMSHDGVLVRKSSGEWLWVAVGTYSHKEIVLGVSEAISLLDGEIYGGISLGLMVIITMTLLLLSGKNSWALLYLILVGGFVGFLVAISLTSWKTGVGTEIPNIARQGLFVICLILGVLGTIQLIKIARRSYKTSFLLLTTGALGVFLFLLPYVLWGINFIKQYTTAWLLSFALGAIVWFVGYRIIRRSSRLQLS